MRAIGAIEDGTALKLCVASRWVALELMDALLPYYPFLIERGPSNWEIHAHARSDKGDCLQDLYRRVGAVLRKRRLASLEICCGDNTTVVIRQPGAETRCHAG